MAPKKTAKSTNRDDNSIIVSFCISVAVLCALIIVYRLFNHGATVLQIYGFFRLARWISLAVAVMAIIWYAIEALRKGSHRKRSLRLAVTVSLFCFSSFVLFEYGMDPSNFGIKFLCIITVISAVLRMVYLIYKWEFFSVCVPIAAVGFSLWLIRLAPRSWAAYLFLVLSAAVCIACFVILFCIRSRGGSAAIGGKKSRFFKKETHYLPMLAAAPICLAALIVGFISYTAAYYCLIVLLCLAFISAVYYTVKLM